MGPQSQDHHIFKDILGYSLFPQCFENINCSLTPSVTSMSQISIPRHSIPFGHFLEKLVYISFKKLTLISEDI